MLKYGQSFWQDYIERSELFNGKLVKIIAEDGIRGITSNPAIFNKAITGSSDYDAQIKELARAGKNTVEIYHQLTVDDIKEACKIMRTVYDRTNHLDGYVSLEVNPQLAFETEKTIAEAKALFAEVGQPNLMIKVPGTPEGIPAVRALIAAGLNINITLLFCPEQYQRAAGAYIEGLEERVSDGKDIGSIHSVASFFLSRIDTQVDKQLDALLEAGKINKTRLDSLRGEAAISISKETYSRFKELFNSQRFASLKDKGANLQRPLWASTGTKDKAYSDTKYVETLIGPHTVNTLPPSTIDAFRDHGVAAPTLETGFERSREILREISAAGVNLEQILNKLLSDGVELFEKSYLDLLAAITEKADKLHN